MKLSAKLGDDKEPIERIPGYSVSFQREGCELVWMIPEVVFEIVLLVA